MKGLWAEERGRLVVGMLAVQHLRCRCTQLCICLSYISLKV